MSPPECGECGQSAVLVGGDVIYPRRPDLAHKKFWLCVADDAYVGCHEGTIVPLGRPAGRATREARKRAHDAFDPLWKKPDRRTEAPMSRHRAYEMLALQLGLTRDTCHIGMMDVEMCKRVVEAVPKIKAFFGQRTPRERTRIPFNSRRKRHRKPRVEA